MTPLSILHVHSTFSLGGKEARAVRLMNAFGAAARHTILSATGEMAAAAAIDPGVMVDFPGGHPPLVGKPSIGRYWRLARYMRQFDLVLTYNWGAMDAVGARRLFGGTPIVHHEDGFNADEVARQKPARVAFRRLMLPAAARVVVPSGRLEAIARDVWRQPESRIRRIANGIAVDRYAGPPIADAIPGFVRRDGETIIGTVAGLRGVKNIARLIRAFARVAPLNCRLVIAGDGEERGALQTLAASLGLGQRILFAGFLADPWRFIGHFDLFALSSDSEQYPISLVEAMAAGVPVVSTDVGDVRAMVSADNRRFVVPPGQFEAALHALLLSPGERAALGDANRSLARAHYGEEDMISAYRSLYEDVAGRPGALAPAESI